MRLHELSFAWPGGETVFHRLSLDIDTGGLTLLVGPNGSGKTTLCRLLAGLEKPQAGSIDRMDCEVVYLKQEGAANLVALTPDDDLAVWQHRFHRQSTDADHHRRRDILSLAQLTEAAAQPVWELSGGQTRRTALAGLQLRPTAWWLLDEPESGLDEAGFALLRQLLTEHASPGALVVTHDPSRYAFMPHRIIELKQSGEEPCDR
ncbi:MAG: ATP-binding cassette domain-containing protein [Candidatus Cloacimonetes bacterium]|nr:ATP-binding cassette domain-containing protein [Candidatus Cloacimonadota bacterium]